MKRFPLSAKVVAASVFIITLSMAPIFGPLAAVSAAACTTPSVDYGTTTNTLSVPATATYRVWSRLFVPDSTSSYLLQIDGNTCFTVGGGAVTPSAWTWVGHHSGSTSNKVELSLAQGNHTLKLIGNAPGVKIDRVIVASDLNCVPSGFGDNCNVPDDATPPSVSLSAPAEGAELSGAVTASATASDNIGVTKVSFYDNSSLIGIDTSSPYEVSWDTKLVPNGSHVVTAKAYDAAGNVSSDSNAVNTKNGDMQAPSSPSNVQAVALSYSSVKISWTASTDNEGVTGYLVLRNGVPIGRPGNVTAFADVNLVANTTYEYKVVAFDQAGNTSAPSAAVRVTTQSVPDTQPPSQPTGLAGTAVSSTQINLKWNPSNDNTGVAGYDIYRSTGRGQAAKVATTTATSFGDSSLSPKTTYTYYVVARDGAGNSSAASSSINVKTFLASKRTVKLTGKITSANTKRAVSGGRIIVVVGNNNYYYQADRFGRYGIYNITPGQYNLTYTARGHDSKTISLKIKPSSMVQNVKLPKR